MNSIMLNEIDKITYPILVLSEDNKFVWSNKQYANLHKKHINKDYSLEKITYDFILPIINSHIYEVKASNKTKYFSIIESKLLLNGENHKLLSFFDISKRHELAMRLSQREEMFELLSEHLPEGIVLHRDKIIYSNSAFEKLFKVTRKTIKRSSFIELFPQENQAELSKHFENMLLNKTNKFEYTTQLKINKATSKHIKISTETIKIDNTINYLSIVTDITKEIQNINNLSTLAYFDTLTGAYNRRKFNEFYKMEYSRSKRYKRNLSALFFDIDHFKRVNDNFGHDIGDEVLIALTKLVKSHIRETDIFARWGGEEFILLLPETDIEEASTIAENLRNNVEANLFHKVGQITISIGCSKLKENEQKETFIKRLDKALYKAKNEGRNKVIKL